jgi:hypothetical protein
MQAAPRRAELRRARPGRTPRGHGAETVPARRLYAGRTSRSTGPLLRRDSSRRCVFARTREHPETTLPAPTSPTPRRAPPPTRLRTRIGGPEPIIPTWMTAWPIAARGVPKPSNRGTATTTATHRSNTVPMSPSPLTRCSTPSRENPAASRRISSPAPGHALGNVENNRCTPKQYESRLASRGTTQKGEFRVTHTTKAG